MSSNDSNNNNNDNDDERQEGSVKSNGDGDGGNPSSSSSSTVTTTTTTTTTTTAPSSTTTATTTATRRRRRRSISNDNDDMDEDEELGGGERGGRSTGLHIHVRVQGREIPLVVDPAWTVQQLCAQTAQQTNVPAEQQRVIYSGHILKPSDRIDSLGIQDGDSLYLVPPAVNSAQQQAASVAERSGSNARGFSSPEDLAANPEMLQSLMNMPFFRNVMNNPETMRTMLMANPRMRELIEQNPELGHILNDPQTIQQSMELARNPELMREMQRGADRALQNIEMLPEGFNTLRRLYSNLHEPMMDAATANMQSQLGMFDSSRQKYAAILTSNPPPVDRPNTSPLPNPWASPSSRLQPRVSPHTPTQRPQQRPPFGMMRRWPPTAAAAAGTGAPAGATAGTAPTGTGAAVDPARNFPFSGSAIGAPPNYEEMFATQLEQLHEMGFMDNVNNIRALLACGGDVPNAIEWLMNNGFL